MSDLISREAAIAAIEAAKLDFPGVEDVIDRAVCLGLCRAILEVSALAPLWVSVNDRLPPRRGLYLVAFKPHTHYWPVDTCEFFPDNPDGNRWLSHMSKAWEDARITHWMECPCIPAE